MIFTKRLIETRKTDKVEQQHEKIRRRNNIWKKLVIQQTLL